MVISIKDGQGPVAGSAIGALAGWANSLDGWVRLVTEYVLAGRCPLDQKKVDASYAKMLAEKGLSTESALPVAEIDIAEATPEDAPPLRLVRIAETQSVNRLIDGQEIAFNDRITVIYGENASGKTGYSRVLKQIAGARSAGQVLPDVYRSSVTTPAATIEYSLGGHAETLLWRDGLAMVPALSRICVFDAPAAPQHVDDDLTYLYTPADIALFEYVNEAMRNIRDLLSEERARRAPKGNPFLSRFRRGTSQFSAVESLRASTDLDLLLRLSAPIADEEGKFDALRERSRNLESGASETHLEGARASLALFRRVVGVADQLLQFPTDDYATSVLAVEAAQTRVDHVSKVLFDGDDLPGLFSKEWAAFISATQDYGVAHIGKDFPSHIKDCPYCRQPLSESAGTLIGKYGTYLLDDAQAALRVATRALDALARPLVEVMVPDKVNGEEGGDSGSVSAPIAATGRVRALAIRQQGRVVAREPWDLDADLDHLRTDRDALERQRATAEKTIKDLTAETSERTENLGEAKAALFELEDRRTLRALFDAVVEHVEAAKWVDLADAVLRSFQGLLRSGTDAMKAVTRGVLNSNFEATFQQECSLLNCPPVRLEFPGRQGAALRHKSVGNNHRLGDVLSEGEQKVIALADFLAEISMRQSSSPIILDDPITSLDARRLDEVADRIVGLSSDHQVIVFTHNIYFATKLLSAFDTGSLASHCTFYEVLAEDGKVGLITRGTHPRMDTPAKIAGRVNDALQHARAASGAGRADLICTLYGHIRSWIEAFIEDDLLKKSVKRHRANIMVDALGRVSGKAIDESMPLIQVVFDRACERMWAHAHTAEQLQTKPTLSEVEEDWRQLMAVAEAVKSNQFPIVVPSTGNNTHG